MTKTLNKKVLAILLAVLFSFCWFAVPASAEEITDYEDYCSEGAGVICIEDVDEMQSRSIDRVILNELFVYGYGGKSADGNPIRVSMGPKGFGYSRGPATILNCFLPNGFYNMLSYNRINTFLCYLTFSVEGTNVQRYKIEVNNTVVIDKALNSAGKVTVYWTCPRQMLTSYKVVVYSDDNSATASGKIYAN